LKSNIVARTAVLILTAAAFLFGAASASFAQGGATSPQELGSKRIAAVQAQSKEQLLALINPKSVEYMEKNDPGRIEDVLNTWLETNIPPNPEFVLKSLKEMPEYNAAAQTFVVGPATMYFPTAPTDLLVLIADREVTVKENGKDVVKKSRAPVTIDAVMQENGVWYVVLPVITKTQQPAQPQQQPQQ